ncbi:MAG TPA: pyruvate kinase [Actinomycetota bacterium]|nr:pyruvate kinase [Actinomycetota bacterium]
MSRRGVKLVCTLGPATATLERVRALADAGCDVFRINLSHGDREQWDELFSLVRAVSEERGDDLAVLSDLPGPKIRLGRFVAGEVELQAGTRFELRPDDDSPGDATGAGTTYAGLAADVRPGDRILLADGSAELVVASTDGSTVASEVVRAGLVRSGAGVNVPAERLGLPAVTERDRMRLAEALGRGADLVAQSFVRSAADVAELRELMGDRVVPIVAKIETRPAVEGIDAILGEADAIMVARGDLGVELPMAEIPILQKELLRAAASAARPVIVATQMLESMTASPRPTRAEATDVATAVLDGADAIMLSAETAIGAYPVEAATAAVRIAQVAEERGAEFRGPPAPCTHEDEAGAVAHAAARIAAADRDVVAITCYTQTGRTAALLSAERPSVPVYAFVPKADVRRELALWWGVRALPARIPEDTDEMIALMDEGLRAEGFAEDGEAVVMAASSPAGIMRTNMLKVHHIGAAVR